MIRTKHIFVIIFLLAATMASAQQFKGGLTAGLAGSQVKGDGLSGYEKAGIIFGTYVNLELTNKSALQMQMEFFQKGSRVNPDEDNGYYSYLLRLNYIQIPVMYQYRYNELFGFETGLSYAVLISDYEEIYDLTHNVSDEPYETSDVSFHLGTRWFINELFTAEVEFSHSLFYIRKQTEGFTWFFDKGMYNNVLQLSIQYEIRGLFGNKSQ